MKKKPILILIGSVVFLVLFTRILSVMNIVAFYSNATTANMPTLKPGALFMASKLKDPNYGSFVCFRDPRMRTKSIFRLIGKPGDVIEIKDAVVYRNGTQLNEPYTWNEYILSKAQYESIAGFISNNKNEDKLLNDSTHVIALTDKEISTYNLKSSKYTQQKGIADSVIFPEFKSKGYNADNFGPVTVPASSFFLMGDNRHDAYDSRYFGFVKAEDILSTGLNN